MHCAVRSDCAGIVLLLLESNPDLLLLKDHDGNTPVHIAALYHQYDCLYAMLQEHSGLCCLDIINETGKRPTQLVEDCTHPCFSLLNSEVKKMMRIAYPESCVSTADQLLYESQKAKDILEDERNQSLVKNISRKIAEKISSLDDGKFEIYKRGLQKSSSQCNYPVSIFIDYTTKAALVGSINAMVNDSERNCVADGCSLNLITDS